MTSLRAYVKSIGETRARKRRLAEIDKYKSVGPTLLDAIDTAAELKTVATIWARST